MSKLQIRTKEKRFPVEKNLYGIFFEDINRAGDGGLYPEMIRNRSFEDSIPPSDCHTEGEGDYALVTQEGWRDQFNHGEGLTRWVKQHNLEPTPIPAWYAKEAEMTLDVQDTLNEHRGAALGVEFSGGGSISNVGFNGIYLQKGKTYPFYMFAKVEKPLMLQFTLEGENGVAAGTEFRLCGNGYIRYDAVFTAQEDMEKGKLVITCPEGGCVKFGFLSLMPAETYNGHGLRKDVVEKLAAMHPRFLRFPGGCIVEGFSPATAMYFKNVVGPVWERPGHQLMWHYRSYNGLGFHEYLQLCEDLDMEPLYVFNCGMTCQGRNPVYFEGEKFEEMLQDTMDALEYALGDTDTKWGRLRAQMGHPAPFKMNYMEIGNENFGPEYESRYRKCYDKIYEKYPHMCFIANTHVEDSGLPVDIVDEHFYNTTEYFAENVNYYDGYDRKKPGIFLGELSVVRGWVGMQYAAVGEAAFLIGAERNQDVVRLISYAPLLENVDYNAWFPNLIRFNHKDSIAIPSYYAWKMFGGNRGDQVVSFAEETRTLYHPVHGGASLQGRAGLCYKNALWDGKPLEASHELLGHCQKEGDSYRILPPDEEQKEGVKYRLNVDSQDIFIVYGEEEVTQGVFDIDILVEEGDDFSIGVYSSRMPKEVYMPDETNPPKEWNAFNVRPFLWKIEDGCSSFVQQDFPEPIVLGEKQEAPIKMGEYNHFHYEVDGKQMRLTINGRLMHTASVPSFPGFVSVTTDTDEEIIVKAVNLSEQEDAVEISLDCAVENAYEAIVLAGDRNAENSFENPENVHDVTIKLNGAAQTFTYLMPATSVNVIRLKKSQSDKIGL